MPETADALDAALADLDGGLTVQEAAALIDVHPVTIYRAVKSGRLRASSRGGGQTRRTLTTISRAALAEYLQGSQEAA